MERINRAFSFLVLVGLIGAGLGADDPATQPTVPLPDLGASATVPAAGVDSGQANQQPGRGGNRRNRGGVGGGGGGARGGDTSGAVAAGGSNAGLDKYAVLKSRSIFVKGNQTIAGDNPTVRPTFRPNPGGLIGTSSSKLVFNGVIVMGEEPNAMIENQGNNTVTLLHVGEPLAQGRLSSVTFDDITYEANGNQKKIFIGQNMDGETPTMAMAAPPTPPSTQPVGALTGDGTSAVVPAGGVSAAPTGGSADDVLARMKAKRNAELGIK